MLSHRPGMTGEITWPNQHQQPASPQANACAEKSVSKSTSPRAGPGTIISPASRRAHGAAYATYVGSWRKRFRITKGKTAISRYEDAATKTVRSFCSGCGTPLAYERARSPHMVNIPRALFSGRTGRQPLYHIAIEELQEWAYAGEPLVPLRVFPAWSGSARKRRRSAPSSKGCSDQAFAARFAALLPVAFLGIVVTKSTPRFTHFFSPAPVR